MIIYTSYSSNVNKCLKCQFKQLLVAYVDDAILAWHPWSTNIKPTYQLSQESEVRVK